MRQKPRRKAKRRPRRAPRPPDRAKQRPRRAKRPRRRAKSGAESAADEKKARDHAEDLLATSTMMLARSRFEENQASHAEALLEQIPGRFRFTPWRLLKQYVQGSLFTCRGHTVASMAFAADAQLLATASWDKTVKLWDARTGQELRTLHGHTSTVMSVAFAADGQVLATASLDKTVKLWDTRTGQELRTRRAHAHEVWSVAFADGQVLASASYDGTVKVWDTRTGQELRTLRGHTGEVASVAFTGDGQVLASASEDKTIKLWDTRTGQEPEKERHFRLWITAPDLHLHRELAEQADKDKAFRLGRYLAAKNCYAAEPKQVARLAGWLGTGPQYPGVLAGLPVAVKTPFHEPTFPDGIACTGVLYRDSGIAPARLLIGTARAHHADSSHWLNRAFHGGALFRNGEHARAVAALNDAAKLHGKASPLTHCLLALAYLQLGEQAKAKDTLAQAAPARDAPWEDVLLHRLFQPEIAAALAKADGNQDSKKQ